MKQACKAIVFMFSILMLPALCFAQDQYDDRTYLSSVLGILQATKSDSKRTLQTTEDTTLKELAKQTGAFEAGQTGELENLVADAGGKDAEVVNTMKPEEGAFSMNMDLDRTYAKCMLAHFDRIIELSEQAQASSQNEEVKAYAGRLIEAASPIRDSFKTWVNNWKPSFKGGFG